MKILTLMTALFPAVLGVVALAQPVSPDPDPCWGEGCNGAQESSDSLWILEWETWACTEPSEPGTGHESVSLQQILTDTAADHPTNDTDAAEVPPCDPGTGEGCSSGASSAAPRTPECVTEDFWLADCTTDNCVPAGSATLAEATPDLPCIKGVNCAPLLARADCRNRDDYASVGAQAIADVSAAPRRDHSESLDCNPNTNEGCFRPTPGGVAQPLDCHTDNCRIADCVSDDCAPSGILRFAGADCEYGIECGPAVAAASYGPSYPYVNCAVPAVKRDAAAPCDRPGCKQPMKTGILASLTADAGLPCEHGVDCRLVAAETVASVTCNGKDCPDRFELDPCNPSTGEGCFVPESAGFGRLPDCVNSNCQVADCHTEDCAPAGSQTLAEVTTTGLPCTMGVNCAPLLARFDCIDADDCAPVSTFRFAGGTCKA